MSKAPKGDHSFQPAGAGKGDADRTSNVEAFRANYDAINWSKEIGDMRRRWQKIDDSFQGPGLGSWQDETGAWHH